jgi:hypothetical protein
MANMASITVKKADGTTDVVYVAASPSAGDKTPAIWTQNAYATQSGFRPRLEFITQSNGAGTTRQSRFKFSYPVTYVDTSSSLTKLLATMTFEGVFHAPVALSTTDWDEAFSQLGNLLCATLVRDSVEAGYSPT